MIFMGIDPGLNKTGVGIVYADKAKIEYLGHHLIKTNPKDKLPFRLGELISGVANVILEYKPDIGGIEDIFHSVNTKSALLLGQARGALIAAMIAHDIPVKEFSALQIKKAVTSYGKAEKEQVKKLVELQLNIKVQGGVPLDVTDALACAICLAYNETRGIL